MTTYRVSEFDPETDPSRPRLGNVLEIEGVEYVTRKVSWTPASVLVEEILSKLERSVVMDPGSHDQCLALPHPSRPGVYWLTWANRIGG